MDKKQIIKIVICSLIAICAIVYYLFSNKKDDEYEGIIDNIVVENSTKEENKNESNSSKIKVYIAGEVLKPGVIELDEGDRIEDALAVVGGVTAQANIKNINLAYEVSDGEKIYIPNISEDEIIEENSNNKTDSGNGKVNINKANASDLTSIPGIGQATAEKIIDYRDKNGKFKTIDDIKNVSGIGNSKFEKIKDNISVK